MVRAVTSLGRNGVADWIIQRISSVVLTAYTVFVVGYLVANPQLDYEQWSGLYNNLCMRIFSLMALLSIAAHGWIGLWNVVTDYVTERMMGAKALLLRVLILGSYATVTLVYLVWGVEVLWGLN